MNIRILKSIVLFAAVLLFAACDNESESPKPTDGSDGNGDLTGGVFVVNEGNFGSGNGTITFINLDDSTTQQDVFQNANGGAVLGNVAQSMTVVNNQAFIVVNNSQKIEVCDEQSLERIGTISGMTSPREIAVADLGSSYVTDLFAGGVWVVDEATYDVVDQIKVPYSYTEPILVRDGKVFFGAGEGLATVGMLYKLTGGRSVLEDSLALPAMPLKMAEDKNGSLWLLCESFDEELPRIVKVNPETLEEELNIEINTGAEGIYAPEFVYNEGRDEFYIMIGNAIHSLSASATSFSPNVIFEAPAGSALYAMEMSPNGLLFLADAKDFVQRGEIMVVDPASGEVRATYPSGIIPGDFYFTNQ